jgi:hypothetical protein
MEISRRFEIRTLVIALACVGAIACGDDDGTPDGGIGGSAAVSGGGAGTAGGTAGTGGRGPTAGGGPTAGTMMMAMCSEPAPTAPVVCGGQTCMAPTFMMNQCVYPCCATVGGAQVCGAKSTNPMFATQCEPPAAADPACAPVMAMGMTFQGCCNVAQNKCGIISTVRPGCITQSTLIMLPDPPLACDGSGDGGAADAGL